MQPGLPGLRQVRGSLAHRELPVLVKRHGRGSDGRETLGRDTQQSWVASGGDRAGQRRTESRGARVQAGEGPGLE